MTNITFSGFEKIENVKKPVRIGEHYLVPCIVETSESGTLNINPVINHPHTDKENGQIHPHYHLDYRFIKHDRQGNFPTPLVFGKCHVWGSDIRPKLPAKIEYYVLPVVNEQFAGITPVHLIEKSKLKHKCIHKNKCPHRGFDMRQVKAENGVLTCPLHGLQFDAATNDLLKK